MDQLIKPFGGWLEYDLIHGIIPRTIRPLYASYNLYKNQVKRIGYSTRDTVNKLQRIYLKKYNTVGQFSFEQWEYLVMYYSPKLQCLRCKQVSFLIPDHIQSARLGGTNWIDNIQPLCERCNSSKSGKHLDYRPDKGLFAKSLNYII